MAGSSLAVATISDGTTSLTFDTVSETVDKIRENSTSTTSGGRLRGQSSGYRLGIDVKARMTPTKYNELKVLLSNGSLEYQYTPQLQNIHPIYVGVEIPIRCQIREDVKDFDNLQQNHVNLRIRGVVLLRC